MTTEAAKKAWETMRRRAARGPALRKGLSDVMFAVLARLRASDKNRILVHVHRYWWHAYLEGVQLGSFDRRVRPGTFRALEFRGLIRLVRVRPGHTSTSEVSDDGRITWERERFEVWRLTEDGLAAAPLPLRRRDVFKECGRAILRYARKHGGVVASERDLVAALNPRFDRHVVNHQWLFMRTTGNDWHYEEGAGYRLREGRP